MPWLRKMTSLLEALHASRAGLMYIYSAPFPPSHSDDRQICIGHDKSGTNRHRKCERCEKDRRKVANILSEEVTRARLDL